MAPGVIVDASDELEARIARLDAPLGAADLHDVTDPDLVRFIRVMASITSSGAAEPGQPTISPRAADEIVGSSRLIARLKRRAPEITQGPLLRNGQYWVAAERPAHLSPRIHALERAHFHAVTDPPDAPPSTKPFDIGLYTSSEVFGSCGMWLSLLQLHADSTLFPSPWTVWSLRAASNAAVAEISTAAEWATFVAASAIEKDGLAFPNWKAVARVWDGVHMTLSAVAATQGISLATADGIRVAPSYWDVESTLWLHWSFDAVERMKGAGARA